MNYALIGCGRISPNHLAAAQANNLNIVGLCDIDPYAMNDKALKFKAYVQTCSQFQID
jgi:UDP-N-acetyl-2-amino-2-deoxyglucuronate dehydrogenase